MIRVYPFVTYYLAICDDSDVVLRLERESKNPTWKPYYERTKRNLMNGS